MCPFVPTSSRGGSGGGSLTAVNSTVLASPAATIDVTGILATAKSLWVVYGHLQSTAVATTDTMLIRFNGDATASNYGQSGGGGGTGGFQTSFTVHVGATTGGIGAGGGGEMLITNPFDTATQIAVVGHSFGRIGVAGTAADFQAAEWNGIWSGGVAINRVTLSLTTGPNFVTGGFMNVYAVN